MQIQTSETHLLSQIAYVYGLLSNQTAAVNQSLTNTIIQTVTDARVTLQQDLERDTRFLASEIEGAEFNITTAISDALANLTASVSATENRLGSLTITTVKNMTNTVLNDLNQTETEIIAALRQQIQAAIDLYRTGYLNLTTLIQKSTDDILKTTNASAAAVNASLIAELTRDTALILADIGDTETHLLGTLASVNNSVLGALGGVNRSLHDTIISLEQNVSAEVLLTSSGLEQDISNTNGTCLNALNATEDTLLVAFKNISNAILEEISNSTANISSSCGPNSKTNQVRDSWDAGLSHTLHLITG